MMKNRNLTRAAVAAIFLLGLCDAAAMQERQYQREVQAAGRLARISMDAPLYAGVAKEVKNGEFADLALYGEYFTEVPQKDENPEDAVYSFLQGPKSWGERRTWAGEWSNEYVNGGYFGNFGCGLCCMANIYSTYSGYECSPWDMFSYARQVSGYSPTGRVGAIGWGDMKVTLKKSGFDCSLRLKPDSYEEFQSQIAASKGAVVLVCSNNDDTLWENTGGHYVNIWLYDEQTDEVFLSDPGSPDRNRSQIPLRYVYDALKTVSQYQYLLVNDYTEEANTWKQNGIDEAWVAPHKE